MKLTNYFLIIFSVGLLLTSIVFSIDKKTNKDTFIDIGNGMAIRGKSCGDGCIDFGNITGSGLPEGELTPEQRQWNKQADEALETLKNSKWDGSDFPHSGGGGGGGLLE